MHFRNEVVFLLLGVSTLLPLVAAGPGGYVTLINASPYDWKLTYSHSYQMDWQPAALIPAGESHEQYLEWWYHRGDIGDCAAEATYELVGSPRKEAFQLKATQSAGKDLQIQYLDNLSSLNNPENSLIPLGFEHDGGVSFILSGDGTKPYVSSNPPPGWMQATLSTIGPKTLREISLPASHDAGMSEITQEWGGIKHNTQTQSKPIGGQLIDGARWFDIRPVHSDGGFHTGHFSETWSNWFMKLIGADVVGAKGRKIADIVADINSFTSKHEGELIILDLSHEMGDIKYWGTEWKLSIEKWEYLYEALAEINDLWTVGNPPQDYTSVPLSTFIQPGSKSAVLVRIPGHAPLPRQTISEYKVIPLSAFIQDSRLPFEGTYSDTDNPDHLATDQVSKLHSMRVASQSMMQRSTWTITVGLAKNLDIANKGNSIIGQAVRAHRKLFSTLWPAMSKTSYPNLIEVDDINSQVTALCMGINDRFASSNPKVKARQLQERKLSSTGTIEPIANLTTASSTLPPRPTLTPTPSPSIVRIKGRPFVMLM
ncbi:PLC-like phosphodiesterase [Hyaloscypha finlandica]|nr:PLC-like phosphodiesterase [Hyaloscypha finlandica]